MDEKQTTFIRLLIEPYGIEMRSCSLRHGGSVRLLIEPYGIEIKQAVGYRQPECSLLIEPYGIEIDMDDEQGFHQTCF